MLDMENKYNNLSLEMGEDDSILQEDNKPKTDKLAYIQKLIKENEKLRTAIDKQSKKINEAITEISNLEAALRKASFRNANDMNTSISQTYTDTQLRNIKYNYNYVILSL